MVVSLDLKASFSSTVTLILTFGWAASYCLTASAQTDFIGSLFWMCHHSIVTGSPLLLLLAEPELSSSPLPPHATSSAVAARTSTLRTGLNISLSSCHRMSWVL